ncbi:MAG: DUF1015 domain-containing protein [Desulfobacteraceae bacterium]|nr:DUF1015 domain-containing protein [Desulfobacteraceae bacterium]
MNTVFNKIALKLPEVYLPSKNTDPEKWSVIACDQYTSHPEYWEKTADFIGDSPSTLNIILPEVFLGSERESLIIENIHSSMNVYLEEQILEKHGPGIFMCERTTSNGKNRKGIICCLDLEHYDYSKDSKSLIRPTEGTIVERIPPRIKVRQSASLETPHIMVLIDDPEKKVIEPLFDLENKKKIYDFQLMNNSGKIKGFMTDSEDAVLKMTSSLYSLIEEKTYCSKYNIQTAKNPLLFAMGDGNHSFATARAFWEKIKEENKNNENIMNHPARWALVEIVNIHDESIQFEPIHRVLFNIDPEEILSNLKSFFEQRGSNVCISKTQVFEDIKKIEKNAHEIPFCHSKGTGVIKITSPKKNLAAGDLEDGLKYISESNKNLKIDYIHGKKHLEELSVKKGCLGFLMPCVPKNSFFKTIIMDGALPRKTFSMGEADDKRFYMECRKIIL